ncbi:hypothetical protein K432DRAFT_409510 [Lepidopterella palustris CBS 459.81]|uniref:Uncharacterized protein n=1 Tax=Lepidopterella palustris CBS 459.81 TaxID=1314670 RepID=A0A8E2JAJ5_9PEZI|nr:hypothetical protein K432DRAFT_409510 [Lepidopterella palustris CBS 459.81]
MQGKVIWDATALKYKIIKSLTPAPEADKFIKYIFITYKKTEDATYFIDIKSKGLQDILRFIIQDVKGTSLKEDKPTFKQNLLYYFLPKLEAYRSAADNRTVDNYLYLDYLDLLVGYIQSAYTSTARRISSLLDNGEITGPLGVSKTLIAEALLEEL